MTSVWLESEVRRDDGFVVVNGRIRARRIRPYGRPIPSSNRLADPCVLSFLCCVLARRQGIGESGRLCNVATCECQLGACPSIWVDLFDMFAPGPQTLRLGGAHTIGSIILREVAVPARLAVDARRSALDSSIVAGTRFTFSINRLMGIPL